MLRKTLIIVILILSLIIITFGIFLIKVKSESAHSFGKEFFNGKIQDFVIHPISGFHRPKLIEAKTILVLFSPDCGACYNQVLAISENQTSLNAFNLILVSPYDSLSVTTYLRKFKLDGLKSLTVGFLDVKAKVNHVLYFPTVIVYDHDGYFLKGFSGGAEIRDIIH